MSTRYYQEGSLERVSRAKGSDVWVYRWRDGSRVQRKKVLEDTLRLKTKAEAKREVQNFRAQINEFLDWRILVFTTGLSLLTGLLFGLIPALQSSKTDVASTLNEAGTRSSTGRHQNFTSKTLVAFEMGLAQSADSLADILPQNL
jgi:hypothetical protein